MQVLEPQKAIHKIKFPPLSEIRTYWPGRGEPRLPDSLYSATGTRMNRRGYLTEFSREEEESLKTNSSLKTRKQWLHAICSDDWASVKPELQERGNPDSPLIRMLIHDPDYLRMYIEYLIMKHEKPTSLLLQELKRQGYRSIASEIMEGVVYGSEDL